MTLKRPRSPSPGSTAQQIFTSSSIEDRSSTFIAVFSPNSSAESLQALPQFKDASHRMVAWRQLSKQRSLNSQPVFDTGHDDDGEKYGGKAVEKVLVTEDIAGAIMVARWYGGVMLGPVRFDHIRNCASNAVAQWAQESERTAKRVKTDAKRSQLIAILHERDQSVAVLRKLLAEKRQGAASSPGSATSSPVKTPNYTGMELAVLERLEHVRDKTIGWILAQIEQAEKANEEVDIGKAQVECQGPSTPGREISSKADLAHEAPVDSEEPAKVPGMVAESYERQ